MSTAIAGSSTMVRGGEDCGLHCPAANSSCLHRQVTAHACPAGVGVGNAVRPWNP